MKILIDGHMIGTHEGGNERYAENIYQSLTKLHKNNLEVLLLSKKQSKSDPARILYQIPSLVRKYGIDLVHSSYILPLIKNCRQVVTIHDVLFKQHPEYYSLKNRLMFATLLPLTLKSADAIIVPSLFTKEELIRFYPEHKNKVIVTYYGCGDTFFKTEKNNRNNMRFILTINSPHPKKNINNIIKSFIELQKNDKEIKLIIVGGRYNIDHSLASNQNIIIYDYVSDKKLNWLYNHCQIFISFSVYEGFNFPVIEALKCGAFVILADIPVNREITKNRLIYINPYDYQKLFKKLEYYLRNPKQNVRFKNIANTLYNQYSWSNTAKETLKIYNQVLNK